MDAVTLSDALESYKDAGEGKRLRGVYLEGLAGCYEEMKTKRQEFREKRPEASFRPKEAAAILGGMSR
jgi:hypothetical protein